MSRFRGAIRYVALIGIGQIAAFAAGILVVRVMPKNDYAAYSAAMTAVAATVIVADSGIGSVLMARLVGVKDDPDERVRLLRGALRLRRRASAAVLALLLSALAYVLVGLGFSILVIVVVSALTASIVANTLLRSLYATDLQVDRRFVPTAAADAAAGVMRLVLVAAVAWLAIGQVSAVAAFLVIGLAASSLQTVLIRRAGVFGRAPTKGEAAGTAVFGQAFRATAPWTALMVSGEQIMNLLFTAFGNPEAVAEIGALMRYGVALLLLNTALGPVAIAEVAHIREGTRALRVAVGRVVGTGLAIAALYVGGLWLFRGPLLSLLGPEYSHLEIPFFVVSVAWAVQFFAVYVLGVAVQSRGWIRGSWVYGPCLALWLIWAVVVVRPTDTMSAAIVVLGLQAPILVSQTVRVLLGLRDESRRPSGDPT